MSSLLTATKFPSQQLHHTKYTTIQNVRSSGSSMYENSSCIHNTQLYPTVTILHPSTQYGNSNTPLGLTPGGINTITHAIQYRVMTTTTRMTKLLYATALAPNGIISGSGYCFFTKAHCTPGDARALVYELRAL
jgi:hypothetical protein